MMAGSDGARGRGDGAAFLCESTSTRRGALFLKAEGKVEQSMEIFTDLEQQWGRDFPEHLGLVGIREPTSWIATFAAMRRRVHWRFLIGSQMSHSGTIQLRRCPLDCS